MTRRFCKILSFLCTLALLFTCGVTALADGELTEVLPEQPEVTGEALAETPGETEDGETGNGIDLTEHHTETEEADADETVGEDQPEPSESEEKTAEENGTGQKPAVTESEKPVDYAPANNAQEEHPNDSGKEPSREATEETENETKEGHTWETEETVEAEETKGDILNIYKMPTIQGKLNKENPFILKVSADYYQTVAFTLRVSEEDAVTVTYNDKEVGLEKTDSVDQNDSEIIYTFERALNNDDIHTFILKTDHEEEVKFSISIAEKKESEAPKQDFGPEDDVFPDDFAIHFNVGWEGEELHFGDTAHFYVTAEGDQGIDYYIVWQWSTDNENWNTVENENGKELDLIVTEENYLWYWRIKAKLSESNQP